MLPGGFHRGVSLVVSEFQIRSVLDVKGNCAVVDSREDRSFTRVVARIHIGINPSSSFSMSAKNVS